MKANLIFLPFLMPKLGTVHILKALTASVLIAIQAISPLACSAQAAGLPTLGDGRQSGTSDSPSILNASPESAVGGGLALAHAIVQRHGGHIQAQAAVGQGCTMVVDWPAEIAPFSGAACAYPASLRGQKHT